MPLRRLLDLVFPPQCLSCNQLVHRHGTLCLECWNGVEFITEPCCQCCGYPFAFTTGTENLCGDCLQERPPFAQARAAFRYTDASRPLILKLKFQDQTLLAGVFANWMASAGRALMEQSEVVVPVPLHYWRFVFRRYNQSALLAQALARQSGLRHVPDALMRTRATTPQSGLSRKQRLENVQGVFAINSRHHHAIRGKRVLLVDDVITTSATIRECTHALLQAGAAQVSVLACARAVQ